MQFTGTVYITFMLVVASTGLMLWDLPKWKTMFSKDNFEAHLEYKTLPTYNFISIVTGMIFFVESLALSISNIFFYNKNVAMILLGVILVTAVLSVIISFQESRKKMLLQ